jgi:Lipocalin-like domain
MIKSRGFRACVTFIASALMLMVGDTALTKGVDATTHDRVIDQLVGGWSLVSRVTTGADGRVLTDPGLSATPSGILIYDRAGHVAAQLSRPGRTIATLADECREAQKVKGTDDTSQTILGYDAYFGTYTVDEKEDTVIHHLQSALFPGDIGKSIARRFAISGDTLTIKFNTTLRDGTPVTRKLVWTRLK